MNQTYAKMLHYFIILFSWLYVPELSVGSIFISISSFLTFLESWLSNLYCKVNLTCFIPMFPFILIPSSILKIETKWIKQLCYFQTQSKMFLFIDTTWIKFLTLELLLISRNKTASWYRWSCDSFRLIQRTNAEVYSKACQSSNTDHFEEKVNSCQPLTVFS